MYAVVVAAALIGQATTDPVMSLLIKTDYDKIRDTSTSRMSLGLGHNYNTNEEAAFDLAYSWSGENRGPAKDSDSLLFQASIHGKDIRLSGNPDLTILLSDNSRIKLRFHSKKIYREDMEFIESAGYAMSISELKALAKSDSIAVAFGPVDVKFSELQRDGLRMFSHSLSMPSAEFAAFAKSEREKIAKKQQSEAAEEADRVAAQRAKKMKPGYDDVAKAVEKARKASQQYKDSKKGEAAKWLTFDRAIAPAAKRLGLSQGDIDEMLSEYTDFRTRPKD